MPDPVLILSNVLTFSFVVESFLLIFRIVCFNSLGNASSADSSPSPLIPPNPSTGRDEFVTIPLGRWPSIDPVCVFNKSADRALLDGYICQTNRNNSYSNPIVRQRLKDNVGLKMLIVIYTYCILPLCCL